MAGHQQPQPVAGERNIDRAEPIDHSEQGVDPGIAGDADCALYPVRSQVGGAGRGWREEQARQSVDRHPVLLLRPRHRRVETAQARLDMGRRHARRKPRHRSAERARRVALDLQQVRRIAEQFGQSPGDLVRMGQRVALAGAAEPDIFKAIQSMVGGIDRMLAGEE